MSFFDNGLRDRFRGLDQHSGRRSANLFTVLVTGLLMLSFVGSIKSGKSWLAGDLGQKIGPTVEAPALPSSSPKNELSSTMSLALEAVAQRYRVAPEALQPIFLTAQQAAIDIDPMLVIAVIGIESGFNPLAQSVMGAQGLMQVIPRYHQEKLSPEARNGAFLDPIINVRIGAQVLREAIRRQGGVVEGLQYYAGAADDLERGYANRVLAEKLRLEQAVSKRSAPAAAGVQARVQGAPARDSSRKPE